MANGFQSSVDAKTEDLMQRIILKEFSGRTILAVVHRMRNITEFDSVVVMKDGSAIEFGNPADLLSRDSAFKELYRHSSEAM